MSHSGIVVFTTAPNETTAKKLARGLVAEKLAACVQLVPNIESIYHWKGELHEEKEVQLIIKTVQSAWPNIETYLKEHHPYEVPEIIALPISHGAATYLSWLASEVRKA